MSIQIQLRRDTSTNWASTNPILAIGEPGLETDTGKFKFGDGTNHWNTLSYASPATLTGLTPAGVVFGSAGGGSSTTIAGDAGQFLMSYGNIANGGPKFISIPVIEDVDAATTVPLVGSYNNNTPGTTPSTFVLTATGPLIIDGYTTSLNDRVLIKDQNASSTPTGIANGVYIVTTAGATGVSAVLTRDNDVDTMTKISGVMTAVDYGTFNSGTFWNFSNKQTDTMGTAPVTINQMLDSSNIISSTNKVRRLGSLNLQQGALQASIGSRSIYQYIPIVNSTTPTAIGFGTASSTGTATARTIANTNSLTRQKRIGYVSSATAGSLAGNRFATAAFTTGDGSFNGGFYYVCRFGISDAATVSGARMFVGLSATTTAPTNVEPSTLINCLGIGHGAADTNLNIYWGGSAAQTPVSLGSNFPITINSIYEVVFWNPTTDPSTAYYYVTNLGTGNFVSGLVNGTAGTALPANTTFITSQSWRTNNATALAVGLDLANLYVEVEI